MFPVSLDVVEEWVGSSFTSPLWCTALADCYSSMPFCSVVVCSGLREGIAAVTHLHFMWHLRTKLLCLLLSATLQYYYKSHFLLSLPIRLSRKLFLVTGFERGRRKKSICWESSDELSSLRFHLGAADESVRHLAVRGGFQSGLPCSSAPSLQASP